MPPDISHQDSQLLCCLQATVKLQLVIEEVGKAACRQVLQGTVDINILGLGKIAEKLVVDNLQKVYAGLPAVASR